MAMRLARYLAQGGVAARRKSEELIAAGRVTVNGKVVTNVATNVSESDRVAVDGQGVHLEDLHYVVLNKPKGCVSTVADPEGRPTVMDYLPRLPVKVVPVGRLDFNSEGVLLLTNDGDLAARLLSPRRHVEKTYHVKVQGHVEDAVIEKLRKGVTLDDGRKTRPAQVDRLKARSKHDWLVITLQEGLNRQIHRMLEAVGHSVTKIQRVSFAGIAFHGLRVGDARELDAGELKALRDQVELGPNPRSVAKGKWKARREDTDRARRARARARAEAAEGSAPARSGPASKPKKPGRSAKPRPTKARAAGPGKPRKASARPQGGAAKTTSRSGSRSGGSAGAGRSRTSGAAPAKGTPRSKSKSRGGPGSAKSRGGAGKAKPQRGGSKPKSGGRTPRSGASRSPGKGKGKGKGRGRS